MLHAKTPRHDHHVLASAMLPVCPFVSCLPTRGGYCASIDARGLRNVSIHRLDTFRKRKVDAESRATADMFEEQLNAM